MTKLTLNSISKSIGERSLFQDVSLTLEDWDRLSITGPNGCGKSTLLNIISGLDTPDSGTVDISPSQLGIGYCTQDIEAKDLSRIVIDWVLEALPSWNDFWHRWQKAQQDGNEKEMQRLADEQSRLENFYGYQPETKARSILQGLGFDESMQSAPLQNLSGGWRERAKLAQALIKGSDIILLDEPTNHLDLEALNWLEQFLKGFKGIVVFVAHDRYFLDQISSRILYLGNGFKPIIHKGNFSSFLSKQQEIEETTKKEIEKIDRQIEHKQKFVDRFRYKASKASLAQSRIKQIQALQEKKQELHLPEKNKNLSFRWQEPERSGDIVLSVKDMEFSYESGDFLWPNLSFTVCRGQKIALLGQNGCGKSTLLKLIMGELSPDKGEINLGTKVKPAYFSQHMTDKLLEEGTVLGEMRRLRPEITKNEEIYAALGLFLLDETYWEHKIRDLSGGERSRLLLASIFLSGANFLLLDEPTNNLDLESRESLIHALKNFGGTLLMVAHDRHLLHEAADRLLYLSENGLELTDHGFLDQKSQPQKPQTASKKDEDEASTKDNIKKDRKEQKRQEAQRRNYINQAIRSKNERYQALEGQLEEILHKQEELEGKLADPETYKSGEDVTKMNKDYKSLQKQSEEIITEMQSLEEEIEQIQKEFE
ncbi:MAG: ATP-binding cassette domain-containing protein [Thermodesulfobacteriota bacterium]